MRDLSIHLMDVMGEYVCIEQHSGGGSMEAPEKARGILKCIAEDSSHLTCTSYSMELLLNVEMNKFKIDGNVNSRVYQYDIHYSDEDGNDYYLSYKGHYIGTIKPAYGNHYEYLSDVQLG